MSQSNHVIIIYCRIREKHDRVVGAYKDNHIGVEIGLVCTRKYIMVLYMHNILANVYNIYIPILFKHFKLMVISATTAAHIIQIAFFNLLTCHIIYQTTLATMMMNQLGV